MTFSWCCHAHFSGMWTEAQQGMKPCFGPHSCRKQLGFEARSRALSLPWAQTVSDLFSWLAFPFGLWMVSHARELKVFYGSLQNDWIALFQSWLREKIFAVLPSDFYFFFLIFYCSSIKPWRRIWRTVYYIHFCVPRAHNPLGSIKLGAAQWQMSSVISQSSHCLLPSPP